MRVSWVTRAGGLSKNSEAVGRLRAQGVFCIAVSDGFGGKNRGDVASKTAVNAIISSFESAPEFSADALERYFESARKAVREKALTDPKLIHMECTLAVLLVKGKKAFWAHEGDSRIYRFSGGRISDVTEDMSRAFEDFMSGKIEYDDICKGDRRHELTGVVGATDSKEKISEIMRADNGDAFLLCTDGFWEYLDGDEMEEKLAESRNSREWVEKLAESREDLAGTDSDNYTIAAVVI